MFPPQQGISLDLEALSGICGSISIACWVVVFSPQIIENFRRGSAEGLSIVFIVIWLAGDVFNILGAILQGVLPTMIILAVYYTLADIVLLGQCFYYRGFTLSDEVKKEDNHHQQQESHHGETRPLLLGGPTTRPSSSSAEREHDHDHDDDDDDGHPRPIARLRRHLSFDGAHHLSPVTPLIDPPKPNELPAAVKSNNAKPMTAWQAALFNIFAILLVCAAGVLGWWIGERSKARRHHRHHGAGGEDAPPSWEPLQFDPLGQVFGYLCAVLYLGSRIPQLLLNYKRKSTEGVSLLFFLFACIGNLTYDMSIFAYSPVCRDPGHCQPGEARAMYLRYIAVNASWIAGSLGTLLLDMAIFVQFFLYKKPEEEEAADQDAGNHHVGNGSGSDARRNWRDGAAVENGDGPHRGYGSS
ncbi:putative vacuolar membrane transporter [Exophiala dermatitidis]|uniref:Vacuolar membrane transporter for cationic amino acids n=1 Tax=Exophiala dermatitidis TaxID=5970 RepID=A0AAN6EY41_EXODE|nr:putative vacuolar membrane transporter [Exophiala dermatitidis]KAJ4524034.1 putative vacuolar membrane transporter [Exophiala dermatitidis]KAJ4525695.1 putative vacuolar membrane transporter [Exophiala dermatitidis]KAJ4537019.1 putative vacuolar membrane transporter [Exophiala dermatitidis]KAJ4555383.1 putative vacuolar membrane transporter [Exophiala dermatitidis]